MENKNNNIWGIIIGISIFLCIVLGVATVKDTQEEKIIPQNKETQEQYQEVIDNTKTNKDYAVLYSNTSVSHDVYDFTNRTISKGRYEYIEFRNNKLLWIKRNSKDEEIIEEVKTKHNNIVSVLNNYTCKENLGFYYLTSDNEIYYFDTRQGILNNIENETLIATDAIGIARYNYSYLEGKSTCRGFAIIYKSTDGYIYNINLDENGNPNKTELFRMNYDNEIQVYNNEEYSLSLINEKIKISGYEYLKNELGKEIVAKEVYVSTDSDLNKETRTIIIDSDSKEYVFDEENTLNINNGILISTGKIVNNVQVIRSGVYMFSYIDGTNKTYELERIY